MQKFNINESIIDPKYKQLSSDVFDNQQQLLPIVKYTILFNVHKFLNDIKYKLIIKKIYIVGSILGHHYIKTSDIDIQIIIDKEETLKRNKITIDELYEDLMEKINKNSGKNLPKAIAQINEHPIQLYIVNDVSQVIDSKMYDIIENKWEHVTIKETEKQYELKEYINYRKLALKFVESINAVIDNTEINLYDYDMLKSELKDADIMDTKSQKMFSQYFDFILKELNNNYQQIQKIYESLKESRLEGLKKEGQYSKANIVYKFLERYQIKSKLSELWEKIDNIINLRKDNKKKSKIKSNPNETK